MPVEICSPLCAACSTVYAGSISIPVSNLHLLVCPEQDSNPRNAAESVTLPPPSVKKGTLVVLLFPLGAIVYELNLR